MSFNRPNLHYEVRYKSADEDAYTSIVRLIHDFNFRRRARLVREGDGTTDSQYDSSQTILLVQSVA